MFSEENVREANFYFHGMVQAAVLYTLRIVCFLPGKDEKQFPSDTAETFNSWQTHGKSSDTGRKLSTMRVQ